MIEIVNKYEHLLNSIDSLIEKSGFEIRYLCALLEVNQESFNIKRKEKSFSVNEVKKLATLFEQEGLESNHDFAEDLPAEVLEDIRAAKRQIREGKVIGHEEVLGNIRDMRLARKCQLSGL